jgi:hypothetical protein
MTQLNKKHALFVLLVLALLMVVNAGAFAQVGTRQTTVTDCTDEDALEAAILASLAGGTITFGCGTATIPFTADINIPATTGTIIIDGGSTITLEMTTAGADSRFFDTTGAVSLTLRNLTLQEADLTGSASPGGAIRLGAFPNNLNIENVVFKNNKTGTGAGGVIAAANPGTGNTTNVNVFRSAFVGNASGGTAGVFSIASNTNLNVANSTFSGSTAVNQGGVLRLTGGGVANFTNNTFVNNTAGAATGEIFSQTASTLSLRNNILTSTTAGQAYCEGTATDSSGNLVFNGACTGIIAASTADPALTDNTSAASPHYAPGTGSPAVNLAGVVNQYLSTGTNPLFTAGAAVAVDQLNAARDGAPDAGSIEAAAAGTNTPEPTATSTPTNTPEPATNTPEPGTNTPEPATNTPEPATNTPDPNVTPSATPTTDPNATATNTPDPNVTPTDEPATATATGTPLPVPGAFNLLTPPDGVIVRDTALVTAITWSASVNATTYQFVLFKLSDNTRLGVVLDLEGLTAASDADPLTCDAIVCTLAVDASVQAALDNGQYAWTVFASNEFGEEEASNSPFFFTVNEDNLELIENGGFEAKDAAGAPDLTPWVGKNLTGDKIKCNKETKTFSFAGDCAFQFKGGAGENSKIQQNVNTTGLVSEGDTLTFSGYVNTNIDAPGKVATVKISYVEADAGAGANGKDKIDVTLSAATGGYVPFSNSLVLDGTISKVKVQLVNKAASGKLYFDEVSLLAVPAGNATATPEPTVEPTATTDPNVTPTVEPTVDTTATVEPTSTPGILPLP